MRFLGIFFAWHYTDGLKFILAGLKNLVGFPAHYFSVRLLFLTLFSPWKKQYLPYSQNGVNLKKYWESLTYNAISRGLGFLVRLTTLGGFLFFQMVVLVLATLLLGAHLLLPPLNLPLFLFLKKHDSANMETLIQTLKNAKAPSAEIIGQIILSPASDFILKRLLIKSSSDFKNIPCQSLVEVLHWFLRSQNQELARVAFWKKAFWEKIKPIGSNWAFGYTPDVDLFSLDFSQEAKKENLLIGRNEEIDRIKTALNKHLESNCLLIGIPGVGRKTLVLGLARQIPKRVLLLNLDSLLSHCQNTIQMQDKTYQVLKQAESAGNLILLIPEIDRFFSKEEGRIDLTATFVKILGSKKLQIIGLTTPSDFHKYLFNNSAVLPFFERIEVQAPNKSSAREILENISLVWEKKSRVLISFEAINSAIDLSEKLITDIPFPEKAIDLLDATVSLVVFRLKEKIVLTAHVAQALSEKLKIPIGLAAPETKKLFSIQTSLKEQIIGQDQAVEKVAGALLRSRLGIADKNRPMGSFLFLGPTGVGKTETAKVLSRLYFDTEKLLRFDMSEFQGENALEILIGIHDSPHPGLLTSQVRDQPYGVILLDEIEKTSAEVINLLLTVLDEGFLTDANGKPVSFRNLIIIATSNAGAEFIREKLSDDKPIDSSSLSSEVIEYVLKENLFSPEFLNRFDAVVVYKPLNLSDFKQIALIFLRQLNLRLAAKEISVEIDDLLLEKIARLGYSAEFGARFMKRFIQEKIETQIAKSLLAGKFQKGEQVKISL